MVGPRIDSSRGSGGGIVGVGEHEPVRVPGVLGVLDVALGVRAHLDLDLVLERVLGAAGELTGARYAAVGVLDRSLTELERFVTAGVDE